MEEEVFIITDSSCCQVLLLLNEKQICPNLSLKGINITHSVQQFLPTSHPIRIHRTELAELMQSFDIYSNIY